MGLSRLVVGVDMRVGKEVKLGKFGVVSGGIVINIIRFVRRHLGSNVRYGFKIIIISGELRGIRRGDLGTRIREVKPRILNEYCIRLRIIIRAIKPRFITIFFNSFERYQRESCFINITIINGTIYRE